MINNAYRLMQSSNKVKRMTTTAFTFTKRHEMAVNCAGKNMCTIHTFIKPHHGMLRTEETIEKG